MKFVVHLSSVLSVNLLPAIDAFANIEIASAPFNPNPSCFRLNGPLVAKMKVMAKYNTSATQEMIKGYRLGKINTLDFLEAMLTRFPFLVQALENKLQSNQTDGEDSSLIPSDYLSKMVSEIQANKQSYYVFKSGLIDEINAHSIALAIIEDAFNRLVSFSARNAEDLKALVRNAKSQNASILFFSNTNPLNLHCALEVIQTVLNEQQIALTPITTLEVTPKMPIVLSPATADFKGISIAPSYCFNTLSLVEPLVAAQLFAKEDKYISPYQQDLQKIHAAMGESVSVYKSVDACTGEESNVKRTRRPFC